VFFLIEINIIYQGGRSPNPVLVQFYGL